MQQRRRAWLGGEETDGGQRARKQKNNDYRCRATQIGTTCIHSHTAFIAAYQHQQHTL